MQMKFNRALQCCVRVPFCVDNGKVVEEDEGSKGIDPEPDAGVGVVPVVWGSFETRNRL